jgi:Mce-associated membrane protein
VADDTPAGPPRPAGRASTPLDPPSGGTTTEVEDAPAGGSAGAAADVPSAERGRRRGLRRRKPAPDTGTTDQDPTRADQDAATADQDPTTADQDAAPEPDDHSRSPRRPALPLVPVLAVLLVLLLAGCVALWVTRPATSAVRTADYVGALQAARAGIVDVTSFDYVTLDDDIEQIRNVTTGDLKTESVKQLDQRRQQITDAQAVADTTVVGAAVGSAGDGKATVFAVLQSTQQTSASAQAQVQRFRVEITLERVGGRWLLSGITGR